MAEQRTVHDFPGVSMVDAGRGQSYLIGDESDEWVLAGDGDFEEVKQ